MTWGQMMDASNYHAHPIENWSVTSEPKGFQSHGPTEAGFQFAPCNKDGLRIIGFFDKDNVFNLVWFDWKHEIIPTRRP
jgi:hypothetical protein